MYESKDYATISNVTIGTYIIQNNFKLQTFPFDKQHLIIPYQSLGGMKNHNFYFDQIDLLFLNFQFYYLIYLY